MRIQTPAFGARIAQFYMDNKPVTNAGVTAALVSHHNAQAPYYVKTHNVPLSVSEVDGHRVLLLSTFEDERIYMLSKNKLLFEPLLQKLYDSAVKHPVVRILMNTNGILTGLQDGDNPVVTDNNFHDFPTMENKRALKAHPAS